MHVCMCACVRGNRGMHMWAYSGRIRGRYIFRLLHGVCVSTPELPLYMIIWFFLISPSFQFPLSLKPSLPPSVPRSILPSPLPLPPPSSLPSLSSPSLPPSQMTYIHLLHLHDPTNYLPYPSEATPFLINAHIGTHVTQRHVSQLIYRYVFLTYKSCSYSTLCFFAKHNYSAKLLMR